MPLRLPFMRQIRATAVAFAASALFAQAAIAAPPGPDGNRGHLSRLLHNPALVAHLGLTAEQARSAQAISDAVLESRRAAFETALKPSGKAERVALVKDLFIGINEETFGRLAGVLTEAQHQRLKQIEIHTFGLRAFGRPAVIRYLELTPAQAEQLGRIGEAMGERISGIHKTADMSPAAKKEATGRIRQAALQEARQAVRAEQWVKWELLVGADFQP